MTDEAIDELAETVRYRLLAEGPAETLLQLERFLGHFCGSWDFTAELADELELVAT